MSMVRMVATAQHQYASRWRYPDDEYDCEPQHVALMQRLGWARPVDGTADATAGAQTYQTRDLAAASPRGTRRLRK